MTSPVPAGAVPAGWYPDPIVAQQQRYWSGSEWTNHVAPLRGPLSVTVAPMAQAPVPATGADPTDPVHWLLPTGRSWESIAAGYVGLFSIVVVILGPIAIVLGILGLRRAHQGKGHGRGRSIFGIVAGVWGTVLTLAILVSNYRH